LVNGALEIGAKLLEINVGAPLRDGQKFTLSHKARTNGLDRYQFGHGETVSSDHKALSRHDRINYPRVVVT
jgi:hypothetical protein